MKLPIQPAYLLGCSWFLLSLLLSACSHAPVSQQPARLQAWLAPGVRVTLPAPLIDPPFSSQQLLTGTVDGKSHSLVVLLNADGQKITLAGLSTTGIRLFLLNYDASGIHSQQSIVLAKMPPASQVLADIMLSHWPISVWQAQLPTGWQLRDQGDTRQLTDAQGRLVTEIRYITRQQQRLPVSVEQYVFHYHIAIEYLGD